MTGPLPPISSRNTAPPALSRVDPAARSAPAERRRERGEDERREDEQERARPDGGLPRPDEDGHIDVLA